MGIYDEDEDESVVEAKTLTNKEPRKSITKKTKKSSTSVKKTTKPAPVAKKKKVAPVKKKKAPSKRALQMLDKGQKAANTEVKRHLDAGREVYGRRDGEPVVIKSAPTKSSADFFNSIKPTPEYVKHLISCRCFLPQYKEMEIPPDHKFIVFSALNDQGEMNPHYAQCNNCGIIHKVFEVSTSKTLKKESMLTLPSVDDIKLGLPEWLVGLLELHDCDLHIYQEAEFILKHGLWGRFVVLAKERDEDMLLGKIVQILGKELYKVEAFERDESDVRIEQ